MANARATECDEALSTRGLLTTAAQRASALVFFTNISVLLVGDSTSRIKANWLLQHGVRSACGGGLGICFATPRYDEVHPRRWCVDPTATHLQSAVTQKPVAIVSGGRRHWDAVVWNLGGLHHLHMWDIYRQSEGRAINYTFDDYYRMTAQCAHTLNARFPSAVRVVVLSNTICDAAYTGEYAREVAKHREQREDPRYTMQLSQVGSVALRITERETRVSPASGYWVKDADTDGLCACTAPSDGRHFPAAGNCTSRSLHTSRSNRGCALL